MSRFPGESETATDIAQIILMKQTPDELPQAFHWADQFDAHMKKSLSHEHHTLNRAVRALIA